MVLPWLSVQRANQDSSWIAELANSYSMARRGERLIVGLFAAATVIISVISAPGAVGVLGAALALLMLTIAVIDRRQFVIPNALTGASLGLGMVHAAVQQPNAMLTGVVAAAVRGGAAALVFLLIRYAYKWLRGRVGLGLGDVKLAGVAGVWLDWSIMPIAVEIAASSALLVYLLRRFALGRPIRASSRVPFGLFLAPAIWICWVLETTLLAPYQGALP